ncbi:hypothetical protein [Streptomyces hawaiiensis]|uniref:hypothetical protein n=1 Tax=Streptomyces hawaiiensis TaxID=67305 RepID=UPI001FE29A55|nr:hypothetical protein [Streptomyces hawaiiensis]
MSGAGARVGVGTRFRYDGETVEVVEMAATTAGNEVVLKDSRGRVRRLALKELLFTDRAVVIPERAGPSAGDVEEIASVVLGQLREDERHVVLERAEQRAPTSTPAASFPRPMRSSSSTSWKRSSGSGSR